MSESKHYWYEEITQSDYGKSHQQIVLDRLLSGESLTNRGYADERDGSIRLAAAVCELRKDGWKIEGHGTNADPYCYAGTAALVRITDALKDAYYKTDHWRQTRQKRLKFDNYSCVLCHSDQNLQVHHWVYEMHGAFILFQEPLELLSTLCDLCHDVITKTIGKAFPASLPKAIADRIIQECGCPESVEG